MLKKPIDIDIYNDDCSSKKSYKLCIIPWGMMKKAIAAFDKMSKAEKSGQGNEDGTIDAMSELICDLFHNQFTADDLNDHADAKQVMNAVSLIQEEIGANPNSQTELQKKAKAAPKSSTLSGGAAQN